MACAACGVVNDVGRKFCKECGARLALACPACGSANAPDDKFCGECGSVLTSSTAPATAAAAPRDPTVTRTDTDSSATERRLVSVLFVDLVGFTSYSEGRDAEEVRAMLTRYFDAASDAVARHGGRVEKFIGDAVMAVWGTPVAHEDDAERAVRSALEIVDRVRALGASVGTPIDARAGVLTGEAVAVVGAVDQGIVTGDLVNTASRLQSAAEPGTVLVGDRTYRSVGESIACVPVEPLSLKGKAEPVRAWRAVRVISEMRGSNRGAAPEPPFRGRDEELRLAKELLHATGREGRPRLLHVTGVAGIGKSRLVWELQKYLDGLTETFLWHQGRCPSYGDGVTFWALAEMVRSRARIADTDDDATARANLAETLAWLVPDEEERRWIEPRLQQLIGLDGAAGDRDEMFGAWRRFFEHVADQGTVVLVFEDLHWADAGLLDFVESLLEWSRSSPILVLTLARPELADRRAAWGSGVRTSTTLHLDRLADGEIEAMVEGYVDGLPAEGMRRLVARAEGVPMYAVETVRMLASRGVLEQTGESYVAVGDLGDEIDIPETLHALVAARLDGLPDEERALVQDAAVAGHSFTVGAVSAVSGRATSEVEPLLRNLVRKEVLDQDVDPRSAERGQYRFVQAVIQEVSYSTLSKAARRAKHVAVARWLEGIGDEELSGVVASHWLEAYRAEPGAADAEEIAGRASAWLLRASERASSLGAPEQALAYAEQALTLVSDAEERVKVLDRAVRSAFAAGEVETCLGHLRAACADYQALGRPVDEALLVYSVGSLGSNTFEITDLLLDVERRLPEDAVVERALCLASVGAGHAHAAEHAQALEYSERALVLVQSVDVEDDLVLRDVLSGRAFALHMAGRHLESQLYEEATLELARRSGSAASLARALMQHGVATNEDDPKAALAAMLESARLLRVAGIRQGEALALSNVAEGAADLGEFDTAEEALAQSEALSSGVVDEAEGLALSRAMLLAQRGDPPGALRLLAEIEAHRAEPSILVMMRTWYSRVLGLCRYLAGDAAGARDAAAESLALDPSGGNASSSLWVAVQAGAALRDAVSIRAALDATPGLRGAWVHLVRSSGRAAVAAVEGRADAGALTGAALDAWSAAELHLDHANAVICALHTAPDDVAPSHVAQARDFLAAIRAVALLRLLDAAQAGRA